MFKSLMKKKHLEQAYNEAPESLRPTLKKEYSKVVNNLGSKFYAPMKMKQAKNVGTKVGTGKYTPPTTRSLSPPVVEVQGTKRKFIIIG